MAYARYRRLHEGNVGMSYAGDRNPAETYEALSRDSEAELIDVRSEAEWTFTGVPELSSIGKQPLFLAWQSFPGMQQNLAFVERLSAALAGKEDKPLYFICRSGGRSQAAAMAMTAAGFSRCYNVAEGFEGVPDEEGHRGTVNGWKGRQLPWRQS